MRVNLSTRPTAQSGPCIGSAPVTLSIRPSCGLPGEYELAMDTAALLRLLRHETELPDSVIDAFGMKMRLLPQATLKGVDLSDRVLTDIGYFID